MSAFNDFHRSAFAESADIFGTEDFSIAGVVGSFTGVLNEFAAERDLMLGGKSGTYTATLTCDLDQFDDLTGPLERTLDGKRLTIAGRSFKIDRVTLDEATVTLGLANPR